MVPTMKFVRRGDLTTSLAASGITLTLIGGVLLWLSGASATHETAKKEREKEVKVDCRVLN